MNANGPLCLIFLRSLSTVAAHIYFKKSNVFNVIFVMIIEVYIFIQRFGLYGGPVTDCTFVGSLLSTAKIPTVMPAPLRTNADI